MSLLYKFVDSPVGRLTLVTSDIGLVALLWENDSPARVPLHSLVQADHPILNLAAKELTEYFAGLRDGFSIPLDMRGTAFSKAGMGSSFGHSVR